MTEWISQIAGRLVVGHKRDGRCVYDPQARQELAQACAAPGISIAKVARECGVNTNLLSTWVRRHAQAMTDAQAGARAQAQPMPGAFIPVRIEAPRALGAGSMAMQARLANGIVVELGQCNVAQACELIVALGKL